MKINFSRGSCDVLFEEHDKFAGKELYMEGELVSRGFQLCPQTLKWQAPDEKKIYHYSPIDENIKDELIAYFTDEGLKQNFKFELWW